MTAVLDALGSLPRIRGSQPDLADHPDHPDHPDLPELPGLPEVSVEVGALARGWSALVAADALDGLPVWVRNNMGRLQESAALASSAVAGDHLVHCDCRADNVLIDGADRAWIFDWPWAAVGARWLDGLTYLLDGRVRGERVDYENILRTHDVFAGAPASSVDAVLAGLSGGFFNEARRPAPPSMPTIREFQRREGLAAAEWLRERWGD